MQINKKFSKQAGRLPNAVPASLREDFLRACEEGRTGEMTAILKQHPLLIDAQDDSGWTPLHHAAMWAQTEAVQVLLKNNARTDICDSTGLTAAAQAGRMSYASIAAQITKAEAQRERARQEAEQKQRIAACHHGSQNPVAVRKRPLQLKK